MRYFALLNIQHYLMAWLPTIVFIFLFAIGLGFLYFKRQDSVERETRIIERYPGGIEGRNAPFPMVLYLILVGTIAWVLVYIILHGVWEVRI